MKTSTEGTQTDRPLRGTGDTQYQVCGPACCSLAGLASIGLVPPAYDPYGPVPHTATVDGSPKVQAPQYLCLAAHDALI